MKNFPRFFSSAADSRICYSFSRQLWFRCFGFYMWIYCSSTNLCSVHCATALCQGITKRCRLSWLTNSAVAFEPKCGGREGGLRVSANEYNCAHGAQIYFGYLTPYLTYAETAPVYLVLASVFIQLFKAACPWSKYPRTNRNVVFKYLFRSLL